MHSLLGRLNALSTCTMTSIFLAMLVCFLSTIFLKPTATVDLFVKRALVDKDDDYTLNNNFHNDLGLIAIDLSSNLEHLFNWNVKQLFLYLTAEYSSPDNKLNQVVLWDKIVTRGSKSDFLYKTMKTKYYFWDNGYGLRGNNNITLTLSWNAIPNVGFLLYNTAKGSYSFSFPNQYVNIK